MPIEPGAESGRPSGMTDEDTSTEIAAIIAEAAELPLLDVAC